MRRKNSKVDLLAQTYANRPLSYQRLTKANFPHKEQRIYDQVITLDVLGNKIQIQALWMQSSFVADVRYAGSFLNLEVMMFVGILTVSFRSVFVITCSKRSLLEEKNVYYVLCSIPMHQSRLILMSTSVYLSR